MVKLISPVLKTLVLSNLGILWHCAFCCLTLFWQTIWWKSDGFNWTSLCSLKPRVKFLWAHSHFSRTLHEDSQWTFILTKPTVMTRVMRPTSSPKSQECTKYKWNLYFQNTLHCKYSMFISLPCWDRIWEIWAYFPSLPQTAFIALNKPIYLGFKSFERRLEQLLLSWTNTNTEGGLARVRVHCLAEGETQRTRAYLHIWLKQCTKIANLTICLKSNKIRILITNSILHQKTSPSASREKPRTARQAG